MSQMECSPYLLRAFRTAFRAGWDVRKRAALRDSHLYSRDRDLPHLSPDMAMQFDGCEDRDWITEAILRDLSRRWRYATKRNWKPKADGLRAAMLAEARHLKQQFQQRAA